MTDRLGDASRGWMAITRGVSATLNRCELSHLQRRSIDVDLARAQHARYEATLAEHGASVRSLPADDRFPDAVFIEDTAVILSDLAVITRPGAAPRRGETHAVRDVLATLLETVAIVPPGTVDGGDVLVLGDTIWVGRSRRTNDNGFEQLRDISRAKGYQVRRVDVNQCLHLKSAVSALGPNAILINPAWVDEGAFRGLRQIAVDAAEPHAANALWLPTAVVYPASFPGTLRRLEKAGVTLDVIDVSELQKAEGAVTCCSLIVDGV